MSKTDLKNRMSRTFHKAGFQIKKYSPEILVVTGIVGFVASAVMACKATTKASAVLDQMHDEMDKIEEAANKLDAEKYTEVDIKNDTRIVYLKTGARFAKLYGPSVALGTVSIVSILAGHNILRKRTAALAAAYTVVDKSFKEYRERVVERFGKDLDRELRYNIKSKEVDVIEIDENGNERVVKETVNVANVNFGTEYSRFFDDGCIGWCKDPEANLFYLIKQQEFANDKLKSQGYLFLNDVYEMLGIPKSKAGYVVGWIYDEKHPIGDNYVDFGIFNVHREATRDFVNGYERTVLLDFNVDGNILNHM